MAQPSAASPWILEGTEENFETEVLKRSQELPVIVDFWAPWCGPCKELSPILEALAREAQGAFLLVKVDVDQQQGIAAAFGVQSIPHVFALVNGQLVDQFAGALPEAQVRQWLSRFQPTPAEQRLNDARRLENTDPAAAEEKYREALELEPQNDAIKVALAGLMLKQHRNADCRTLITELEQRGFLEPAAQDIKAQLEVRAAAAEAGSVADCRRALAANPSDPQLKLKLAESLGAQQQFEEALELCLEVVRQTAGEIREQARGVMVNLFRMLGPEAELARNYRRKLATALY
jgi:putative thioredoxin